MKHHILMHGQTLCRKPGLPGEWTNGDVWVSFEDTESIEQHVDCDECLKAAEPEHVVIHCPRCGKQHLDIGEFLTKVHRTHLCSDTPEGPNTGCGHLWRPKKTPTFGVASVETKV